MKLATGGEAGSSKMNLWLISASATAYSLPWTGSSGTWYESLSGGSINPQNITIMGSQLDTNGNLYLVLPDNTNLDVTPVIIGQNPNYYTYNITATKYHLIHQCVATYPPDQWRMTVGVGEEVNFSFSPALPTNALWTAGTAGGFFPISGPGSLFTASSNATPVGAVSSTILTGQAIDRAIHVSPPKNIVVVSNTGKPFPPYDNGTFNAGTAGAQTGFVLAIAPTNASFSFADFREIKGLAINISGCFTNTAIYTNTTSSNVPPGMSAIGHRTADYWYTVHDDNLYDDSVVSPTIPPPYSPGSFQWVITNQWKVGLEGTQTNFFLVTTQSLSIDVNGTVTITKFGNHGVTRQTNGIVTNW
jgi:hypothetical protein